MIRSINAHRTEFEVAQIINENDQTEESTSTLTIGGCLTAAFILVIIFFSLMCFWWRKYRRKYVIKQLLPEQISQAYESTQFTKRLESSDSVATEKSKDINENSNQGDKQVTRDKRRTSSVTRRLSSFLKNSKDRTVNGIDNPVYTMEGNMSPKTNVQQVTEDEVYAGVTPNAKKNRMRSESAAAIAAMRSSNVIIHGNNDDTDILVENDAVVIYNERTVL